MAKPEKLREREKNRMKKMITLFLLLAMALSLCACGGTEAPAEAPQTAQAEPTEAPAEPTPTPLARVPFEEVGVEASGVAAVRITDFSDSKGTSDPICLTLETEFLTEYSAYVNAWACVDGVQVKVCNDLSVAWWIDSASISQQEGAGESKLYLDCGDLAACGIKEHTDIDLLFRFQDNYNGTSEYQEVHIYPYGESNARKYEREEQSGDVVLLDNEYVSVTVTQSGYGVSRDRYSCPTDYAFRYFVQNKTDELLMIDCTNPDGYYITNDNNRYVFPDAGYYAVSGYGLSDYFNSGSIVGEGEAIAVVMDWTVKDGFGSEELAVENVVFTEDDPSGFDTLPQFSPVTALETEALTVKVTDLGLTYDGKYLLGYLAIENKCEQELTFWVEASLDRQALPISADHFPDAFDEPSMRASITSTPRSLMPPEDEGLYNFNHRIPESGSAWICISCAELEQYDMTAYEKLTLSFDVKNEQYERITDPFSVSFTPLGGNAA